MVLFRDLLFQSVTVFNRTDEVCGVEKFRAVVLKNVRMEERTGVFQRQEGLASHDTFKLFADREHTEAFCGEKKLEYLDKRLYSAMIPSSKDNYWTFAEGDYLVPKALEPAWAEFTMDQIKQHVQVYTVNAITPVFAGGKFHHWEVSGRGRILE